MGVNTCSICAETYAVSHLGDSGKCRLCEIREPVMRRKIAAEVHALGASAFIVEQIERGPGVQLINRDTPTPQRTN